MSEYLADYLWIFDADNNPDLTASFATGFNVNIKQLQGASRRIKAWIKKERHLSKRDFVRGLNRRLTGHYNYYGIIGNGHAINRFYLWAMECTFKWLNRRGGKRKSFSQDTFWRAVDRGLFRMPRIMRGTPRRVYV